MGGSVPKLRTDLLCETTLKSSDFQNHRITAPATCPRRFRDLDQIVEDVQKVFVFVSKILIF